MKYFFKGIVKITITIVFLPIIFLSLIYDLITLAGGKKSDWGVVDEILTFLQNL